MSKALSEQALLSLQTVAWIRAPNIDLTGLKVYSNASAERLESSLDRKKMRDEKCWSKNRDNVATLSIVPLVGGKKCKLWPEGAIIRKAVILDILGSASQTQLYIAKCDSAFLSLSCSRILWIDYSHTKSSLGPERPIKALAYVSKRQRALKTEDKIIMPNYKKVNKSVNKHTNESKYRNCTFIASEKPQSYKNVWFHS